MDETSQADGPARAPGGLAIATEARTWLICLILAIPAAIPYATHYLMAPAGFLPTGFIFYDMPYYFANGREHFDAGRFHWTYSNPSDVSYDSARIYVQPLSLFLGWAWRATGMAPGAIFAAFGMVAAVACVRVAMALYRHLVGLATPAHWLGMIAFLWGGGLLAAAGIAYSLWTKPPFLYSYGNRLLLDPLCVFVFDPSGGWWFLNLGRNLIFPTEAFYHAIFLGAILCVLRERFRPAAALAALLCISHPFSGIELIGVLGTWSALEVLFIGSERVPPWFPAACAGLASAHLCYYLGYLNRFAEHRSLSEQWSLAWGIDALNFVPAYALVGGFALWGLRRLPLAKVALSEPRNRLFLVWFLVVFAMSNHEFAVSRPVQPIHFTRGYDWMPLFLLGLPSIVALFTRLLRGPGRPIRVVLAGLVVALFLSDNALWLAYLPINAAYHRPNADIYILEDDRQVMASFNAMGDPRGLVVTQNHGINYLASVYTPLRSWSGHIANTPGRSRKEDDLNQLFGAGRFLPEWESETLLVAIYNTPENVQKQKGWLDAHHASKVLENATYSVFRVPPTRTASSSKPGVISR